MANIHSLRRSSISTGWICTLCLFTMAILASPQNVHAQWATNGNNINNTNSGNVGIGTATPDSKLTVNTNSASVNGTVSIAPNGNNNYYASNPHDALFVDGSTLSPHGLYTGAAVRLFRLRSQQAVDSFTVGRWGDVLVSPKTDNVTYAFKLAPDTNSPYAGSDQDVLLISGSNYGVYGLYTGKTVRPLRVTNASGGDSFVIARDGTATFGGNVGVGTSSPLAVFDVRNTDGLFYAGFGYGTNKETFLRAGSSANGVMHIGDLNTSKTLLQENGGNVGIGTSSPSTKLHVAGDITVTGNIAAKYQDVAEWVLTRQQMAPGTVVTLDTENSNQVVASNQAYDTRVAGVISARPGITLGEAGKGKVLVATTGRVKVRVDATRNPIRIGDLLVTSEKEGMAMRSEPVLVGGRQMHAPGTLIGKALEPLANGTGEILVLLSLQ